MSAANWSAHLLERSSALILAFASAGIPWELGAEDHDPFAQKDSRTRVEQILDGLTHMPANSTEIRRAEEWMKELKATDSVAPQLWDYISKRIEGEHLLGVGNALPILGTVPGGLEYKDSVTELMVEHAKKIEMAHSENAADPVKTAGAHSSFMIVTAAIRYFQDEDDMVVISPLLESKDSSVVLTAIGWMAGKGNKGAIEILEEFVESEDPPEFHKDRAVHAIQNIERRFGLSVRSPRRKTGSAPLPMPADGAR